MTDVKKEEYSNYRKIFITFILLSFAEGLFYPFLVMFLSERGGIAIMGAGLGISIISESFGSYFAGELSDRYGRKLFLMISLIIGIFAFLAYPLLAIINIDHMIFVVGLIITLIIDGFISGMWSTVEAAYLGDITHKTYRGKMLGTYWGVGGIVFGLAMIGAGYIGIRIDFLTIAIIAAIIYLIAIGLLVQIKDTKIMQK